MPDAYLDTATTNFDKTIVPLVLKRVAKTLRGGLVFTPKGSILPAQHVSGGSGVFRAFEYGDIDNSTAVAAMADSDADPSLVEIGLDYIEFTASRKGAGVGLTDNAQKLSPHNLKSIAAEKVARSIATHMDDLARSVYAATTGVNTLFAGSSNTDYDEVAANDLITAALLKDAVATLRSQDVPPLANGLYAFVADSLVIRDLSEDDDYIREVQYSDPGSFLTGQIATYGGAAIIDAGSRGIVLPSAGTGSIDLHVGVLIGDTAVFGALGDVEVNSNFGADKADAWNRRDSVTWKAFTGAVKNDLQSIERFATIVCDTRL